MFTATRNQTDFFGLIKPCFYISTKQTNKMREEGEEKGFDDGVTNIQIERIIV